MDSIKSEKGAINHLLSILKMNTKNEIQQALKWAEKYKIISTGREYNSRQIAVLVFFHEAVNKRSNWKIGETLCAMDTSENKELASWLKDTFWFQSGDVYNVFVALMNSGTRLGSFISYSMNAKYGIIQEAARKGDKDLLQWLLYKNVEVDFRDDLGNTALHAAASKGLAETVKFLLERGASMFVLNSENRSPYVTALDSGCFNVCDIMCPKVFENGMMESIIFNIVREGNVRKLQYLLSKNKFNSIWKALEEAVELGYPNVVDTLLQYCPSLLHAPEKYNDNVLTKAFVRGDEKIIEKLLAAGFQVDDSLITIARDRRMHNILNWLNLTPLIDTVD